MIERQALAICFGFLVICESISSAFVVSNTGRRVAGVNNRQNTDLNGIPEWRDLVFDLPGTGDDRRLGVEDSAPPKEVCVLPFPYHEVLLQGETKQLRLYEERFIDLFKDTMENHEGVVAMGLLADSGIIQTVPLCEVEAYNRVEGFGVFVTIRVVGRAALMDFTRQEPYMKALCTEIVDKIPPNLDLPNLAASNIENYMLVLSSMEHQLAQATKDSDIELDEKGQEMERRIKIAKLEDRFYHDVEDGSDEDDDDDEEEEDADLDRRARFHRAYEVAMATDTQGYCVPQQDSIERTPQELTAVSWSSFCTELLPEEDATYRIQALDTDDLLERLKLATWMLREKKEELKKNLETVGIKDAPDESDSEASDGED